MINKHNFNQTLIPPLYQLYQQFTKYGFGSQTTVLNFGFGSRTTVFIFGLGSPTTALNFEFGSQTTALNFRLGSRTTLGSGLEVRLQFLTLSWVVGL